MTYNANEAPKIIVPKIGTMKIGHDKTDVIWQIGNDKTQRLPWEAAIYFSKAIMAQARNIEEIVKHEQVISDQSFLYGQGFPLGLSKNKDIIGEAHKEARYEKHKKVGLEGIPSEGKVGTPRLIMHPPPKKKKEDNNGKE